MFLVDGHADCHLLKYYINLLALSLQPQGSYITRMHRLLTWPNGISLSIAVGSEETKLPKALRIRLRLEVLYVLRRGASIFWRRSLHRRSSMSSHYGRQAGVPFAPTSVVRA